MKNFHLSTICLAAISPFTQIATADVFVVPGQYPTITQAISAAESAAFIPHTIVVGPGTYTETLIINRPNISLLSTDGSEVTIIDGTNLNYRCIEIKETANNFELTGFTVQNGDATSGSGGGIYVGCENAEITSCVFRENFARSGAGLGADYFCELSINNCSFVRNTAQNNGSGIGLSLRITGSQYSNCGGTCFSSNVTQIYDCHFEDNSGGADIDAWTSFIDLQNSTFKHSFTSSRIIVYAFGRSESPPYSGTKIKNCMFDLPNYWTSKAAYVYATSGAGSILVEDCQFINGGLDLRVNSNQPNINGIQVRNCLFESCEGEALLAETSSEQTSISHCQFTDTSGSAVRTTGSPEISNCTFSRNLNSSTSQGSAIAASSGTTVGNSFFCENSNPTISGNYESLGGNLFPPTCELAVGACCLSTSCVQLTEAACGEAGGQFAGFGTLCTSIECFESDPTGACCINGSAISLKQSECEIVLGRFQGAGSTPDGVTCEPADSCPQDLNNSGSIDYADLLEVLSAWGPCE